jgi:hypothetical protein
MAPIWDLTYLQKRLQDCRDLASAALHPDVRDVYLGYVRHYETLVATLRLRRDMPVPA